MIPDHLHYVPDQRILVSCKFQTETGSAPEFEIYSKLIRLLNKFSLPDVISDSSACRRNIAEGYEYAIPIFSQKLLQSTSFVSISVKVLLIQHVH